ncbi:MAG: histidine kinase dimerization/phospho-acceptor domain-containing protein, partial [Candidatus Krumholzibacteriia bacterium]
MRIFWPRNPYLRLALVFFVLVLAPSFLLGYFSLRAVESERVASRQRILADYERYAEFAGRAVHQELAALEAVWGALVPRGVGWESQLHEMFDALDRARGEAFVRASTLMHVGGTQLYPRRDSRHPRAAPSGGLRAPDPAEVQRFQELVNAGETAEFEDGDNEAARRAYARILESVRTPRLRAIAHTSLARVRLRRGDWDGAIREYERVVADYPDAYDLDNQSLRLHAKLQIARALEGKGEAREAAAVLTELREDVARHSDEMGRLQHDIFVERIEARMARLLPEPLPAEWRQLQRRYAGARASPKQEVGSRFFVRKLSRKLLRAALEGSAYSTQVRYLSDVEEGRPFLLAYLYLPDASGTAVTGLAGFEIDLESLSGALLPRILHDLQPSTDLGLGVVDAAGHPVIGGTGQSLGDDRVTSNLGAPFGFWDVAVFSRVPGRVEAAIDFRTRVFLYLVLLLLVTILAGATAVIIGLRREARLSNLKTTFVSNVSHELRTPLTSIRLYAEMLEMAGDSTSRSERARFLRTIRQECDRLGRLIDSVLDFSRIERGTKTYHFEFEEIGGLVRVVAEDFRGQAEGFRFEVSIEEGLPEVRVDADAIRQILLNLLSNAVKYSDDQRVIVVRAFRHGAEVALQVEDHGMGIPPGEQDRIF